MRFFLLLSFALVSYFSNAQEQLGLRLENYAGASSFSLNPTGNLTNPLKWDVNLVGGGLFFDNNYFFIQQANTPNLLGNGDLEFQLAKNVEGRVAPGTYLIEFFDDGRRRYVAFGAYADGPALAVKIGENHSAGIFTRFRTAFASHGISNNFSYYKYDGRPFSDPFDVPKFQGAMLSWSEIGVNYAFKIPNNNGFLGIGANLRYLQGYEAAYLENVGTWEHTKLPGDTITIGHPDGRFGFTNSNLNGNGFSPSRNGSGVGFDLGATQVFEDGSDFYKLKLGVALLDIGYLRFASNAESHSVRTNGAPALALDDYSEFEDTEQLDDLVRLFSQQTLGDSTASRVGDAFTLTLPAAISLQADYAIRENIFANATLIQRLPLGGVTAQRGNLFALTPRYEHRWFSASVPVSLYNWQHLRVGLAVRLGYLVLGTEHLGSFVGKGDYTGTDFYIALKINPFKTSLDLFGGGGGKRRYGGRGKVKCYDF